MVFSAEIWKLRRSLLCEILGNADESRRKSKFKGPWDWTSTGQFEN